MPERNSEQKFGKRYHRKTYTNTYQRRWEESPVQSRESAKEIILNHIKSLEHDRVDIGKLNYLGIGAGTGLTEFNSYMNGLEKFKTVTILDIAKRHSSFIYPVKNVFNLEADAENLPIKTGSIDLATCLMSQDLYPDRDKSTQEIRRVLIPEGKAIVFLHHQKNFEGALKAVEPGEASVHPESVELYKHLLANNKLFKNERAIRKHYEGNGLAVEKINEHKPENPADYWNYWWEVVLRKKAKK